MANTVQPILNNDKQAWRAAKARREHLKTIKNLQEKCDRLEKVVEQLQQTVNGLMKNE